MSFADGFLIGAAQLGIEAVLVRPKRLIGPFVANATVEESHEDELEITDHPVETGAQISDHAYKLPYTVTIRAGWSASPAGANFLQSAANAVTGTVNGAIGVANQVSGALGGPSFSSVVGNQQKSIKDIYADFITLQENRTLIDVYTGKRTYKGMLVKSIRETTTQDTENALLLTIVLRQVIIVSTQTLTIAATSISPTSANLQAPQKNGLVTNSGAKQLVPTGKSP